METNKSLVRFALVALFVCAAFWTPETEVNAAKSAEIIPVLLVTGASNHDWQHTSKTVASFLRASGRFDVTVTTDPAKDLADPVMLSRYRAVFLDYNGPRWGEKAEENFLKRVRAGLGVVVMHAANNAFPGWKDYEALCGLCWREGTGHGKFHAFDVSVSDRNHPITWDLPPIKAHPDELYHKLKRMPGASYRVLMQAFSSKESGGTGRMEPMATVAKFGKGRVFHTPLGHVWPKQEQTRVSLEDPALRLLLARGTEWAATGRVTLGAKDFGVAPLPASNPSKRHDPFVFRCVLDKRPRVAVVALNERLWAAYDLARPGLYKVWGGGIDLRGSVYDASHGPQPRSQGTPLARVDSTDWTLRFGDQERKVQPRFESYRINRKATPPTVTFRYCVKREDRSAILIEETPIPVLAASDQGRIQRIFQVTGLRDGERLFCDEKGKLTHRAASFTSPADADCDFTNPDRIHFELLAGQSMLGLRFRLQGDSQ